VKEDSVPMQPIDEAYVLAAAQAAGLEIPAGHAGAVAEALGRIAEVAAPVLVVPLAPEDELAPIWRPGEAP